MAKLKSYYSLCPLIEHQSLLGVEKDSDSSCAIVTLGRNIVIRYKLRDLKQVTSWSSKERLTTQVIYDEKTNLYAAIFNEKYVRMWTEEEVDLDKVKKYKFQQHFHAILTFENISPVLVRQDGTTASLEWALKNRKKWTSNGGILKNNEKLAECKLIRVNDHLYFCALTKIGTTHNYLVVGLEPETCIHIPDQVTRIELKRQSEELVGHVILQNKNNAYLLTLWSHGRMYSYPLTGTSADPVPGMLVSVFSATSTNNPVAIICLNESTIAAYGADTNEEGAVLVIYNVEFKLVQAVQKLKLYTKDAKLWKIDDKILLAANRHLGVAPYQLTSQKIQAMLGSSLRFKTTKRNEDEDNEVVEIKETTIAHWDNSIKTPAKISTKGLPKPIAQKIKALVNEGTCDSVIYQTLIPDLVKSNDEKTIFWCLDHFNDLSEKLLVDLLAFGLQMLETKTCQEKSQDDSKITSNLFLDKIFSCKFATMPVLIYLKSTLTFSQVTRILNYLLNQLSNDDADSFNHDHLYEWISLLLDSHYQDYLFSQDPLVSELLRKLSEIVKQHFQILGDYENLRPMIERISHGKSLKPNQREFCKFYSIEEIQLY